MSRRPSDSAKANRFVLLVDWADRSPFHLNRSGLRLIATKGWNLYAVDEMTNLMHVYDTEQWEEWIRRIDINLEELFAYSDRYESHPLFILSDERLQTHKPLTLEVFLRGFVGWR